MAHTTLSPRPRRIGRIIVSLGVMALCSGLASSARASCYSVMVPQGALGRFTLTAIAPAALPVETSGPDASGREPSIVGLWRVAISVAGQVINEAFEIWHSDGTEVLNDTSAPSTGNVCLGVWEQKGRLAYKLKHPSWTFEDGNLTGTAIFNEHIRLHRSGTRFTGTTSIDLYDLDENLLFHGEAEIAGTRITAD